MERLRVVIDARKGRVVVTNTETRRVRYLLGLSPLAERERLEAEYFEDNDAFQEMLTAEDDLIDAYARGDLPLDERRRFEQRFATSARGRNRVQFARAFTGAVSVVKPHFSGLAFFHRLQLPLVLRTATIAAVITFVVVLAGLVIDRQRTTNELGQLHLQYEEVSKQTEALRMSSEADRTRAAALTTQLAGLQQQPEKPKRRRSETTTSQPARRLPEIKIDPGQIVTSEPKPDEKPVNTLDTYIDPVETTVISHEPGVTDATLPPASSGSSTGFRLDPRGAILAGVEVDKPLYTYALLPRQQSGSGESTMRIPTSPSLIRFRMRLEKPTGHKNYQFTVETADGNLVSVGLSDLIMPGETTIHSHALPTPPSGRYVLLLSGEESDGSFVKVAEYSFRIISF